MPADPALPERITRRADVFNGKPLIRDMRIPVEHLLSLLSQGSTPEQILADYPRLEPADLRACLAYARILLAQEPLPAALPALEPPPAWPPQRAAAALPAA